jgi:hypothetical protein
MDANTSPSTAPQAGWIEIRDTSGKMLFRYDPFQNVVQIKQNKHVQVVELDRIRSRYGVPVPAAQKETVIGRFIIESGD